MSKIRNFCIIAHIDHGKSTLADRLIQRCGAVDKRRFRDQILDSMDIERERGITIKSNTITLEYEAADGETYRLNLIDTPGHVDFSHEVRRSLMSCEGALLLIDASQGVEAQTVANLYLAMEYDLDILPVINKIDLPSADIERVKAEIESDLGLDPDDAVHCSAKEGIGIDGVLEAIVQKLPGPEGERDVPPRALLFDAQYDSYRGVVLLCRVREGSLRAGMTVRLMHSGKEHAIEEVGETGLDRVPTAELGPGAVGYVLAGIKTVRDVAVGDTLTDAAAPAAEPLPGYKEAKPVVFSSIYPMSTDDYLELSKALDKLVLNDAALTFEKDSSAALGHGFRCGFLGLLHLEVVQERLRREYGLSLLLSAPSVRYRISLANGEMTHVDNPSYYPDPSTIAGSEEPYIKGSVMMPERYIGPVMELCRERRGVETTFSYLAVGRVEMTSELPLSEVLFDFYDRLKSITQGYGSFDYEILDYRPTDLAKIDILVNGEPVDALSQLAHREKARTRALHYCERLAETIPRHQFKIAVQGAIGGTIIARTNIQALRKDVTAKCYGGDITRKRKLLEKQKEGKKRMKTVGNVEIPQSAFVAVLKDGHRFLSEARAGLYLHVPFCRRVCPYCDFAVRTGDEARRRAFVDDLIAEIGLNAECEFEFDTVYFGGGTPSALATADLVRILDAVREHLRLSTGTRVFLEANPEDVSPECARAWKEAGVEFLSLGLQALDAEELRFLGRQHDVDAGLRSVETALDAGFHTVSVDLIYGLPGQRVAAWETRLKRAAGLRAQHFSCYQLTIHRGTRFGLLERRGELTQMPSHEQGEMFRATHRRLDEAGFGGYEVSNFAVGERHRSAHNMKYWDHTPYLGLGPSAHSFDGRRRWWNLRRTDLWEDRIREGRRPVEAEEVLRPVQLALESLMTGLRTYAGVDLARLHSACGVDVLEENRALVDRLTSGGLLRLEAERLVPTLDGLAVADSLAPMFELDD